MSKLLSLLVAAIFAAVTLSAVAVEPAAPAATTKTEAAQPGNAGKKTEKKAEKKKEKKVAKKKHKKEEYKEEKKEDKKS
jgi:Ni/Co efflux regulator RcnB